MTDPSISRTVADMSAAAPSDRFQQWDLITVTPWGAPVFTPVGARYLPGERTLWTSTTVGYPAKLRNIRANPRVSALRQAPGEALWLARGWAEIIEGDGTANLTQLFQLMEGPGTVRPFFGATAQHPLWRPLYRAYWRRVLICVHVVELLELEGGAWTTHTAGDWPPVALTPPPAAAPRRREPMRLDRWGETLIDARQPAALAAVLEPGQAPQAWPVEVTHSGPGRLKVRGACLPAAGMAHASLAVRVVDDSFEMARMVGWIGALQSGDGARRFTARSAYGFRKPPGLVADLAAGVATTVQAAVSADAQVSPPDPERAAAVQPSTIRTPPELPPAAWRLVKEIFARRNAVAAWYSASAVLHRDPQERARLERLARWSELERDWAQRLLLEGGRPVGPVRLLRAAAGLPLPPGPEGALRRREKELRQLRSQLRRWLSPQQLALAPRPLGKFTHDLPLDRADAAREALSIALGWVAAAADRLLGR